MKKLKEELKIDTSSNVLRISIFEKVQCRNNYVIVTIVDECTRCLLACEVGVKKQSANIVICALKKALSIYEMSGSITCITDGSTIFSNEIFKIFICTEGMKHVVDMSL